jgi:integrase
MRRKKKTGEYQASRSTFRLKGQYFQGKEIAQSLRQLSKRFNVELTSERQAEPYWRRYLAEIFYIQEKSKRESSPLQRRLISIEAIKEQGTLTPELQKEYDRCLNIPAHDIDNADLPVIHPDIIERANFYSLSDIDEFEIAVEQSRLPRIPQNKSLKREADIWLDTFKRKDHTEFYQVRATLNLYLETTGHISLDDITVDHYRETIEKIRALNCGETTKSNKQKYLARFLKYLAGNHDLRVGYIDLHENKIFRDAPKKIQFADEQVFRALQNAKGIIRSMLLLGLNCGMYRGDICNLKPEHIHGDDNEFCSKAREKLKNRRYIIVPTWYLWKETRQHIRFDIDEKTFEDAWKIFKLEYDLPNHKALRSTVAQWLQDNINETVARLYRGEAGSGEHHRSYIRPYTTKQNEALRAGLEQAGAYFKIQ